MTPREMTPDEFREHGYRMIDWVADYLANIREYPVLPGGEPGTLTRALPGSGPTAGEEIPAIFADFERLVLPMVTHWNHPRFHAYFSISSTGPGILGELLMAALNVNGMLWKSCPAATELEQVTLDWLRQWLGLPEGLFGIIYDTASISTLHAIAAARERIDPEVRTRGSQPGLTLYCSAHAHSSVEKGAIALGVGQENVRKIGVDAEFRMNVSELQAAIQADRAAGKRPFCVVAAAGTTATTSIDPLAEIADVAKAEELWLHVDAAYGGAMAVVPEYQPLFLGWEQADSIVVNPHKWLFVPVDCSVFYTRHPEILRRAFTLVPDYLQTWESEPVLNYMDYGVQLGRRFRSLKLWFVLRYYGRDGLAALVRQHVEWARKLAALIAANERFELMAPVPMATVCFRRRVSNEENQRLMNEVNATGRFFLSHTVLHGQFTWRVSIGNAQTSWADLQELWETLRMLS